MGQPGRAPGGPCGARAGRPAGRSPSRWLPPGPRAWWQWVDPLLRATRRGQERWSSHVRPLVAGDPGDPGGALEGVRWAIVGQRVVLGDDRTLGVASDRYHGVPLVEGDEPHAHGDTSGHIYLLYGDTGHSAAGLDREDLVVLVDHAGPHEGPAGLGELHRLYAEAAAVLQAVVLDGGPLGEPAVGDREHGRTRPDDVHGEQLVVAAEPHAHDAGGG